MTATPASRLFPHTCRLSLVGAGHSLVKQRGKRLQWLRTPPFQRYRVRVTIPHRPIIGASSVTRCAAAALCSQVWLVCVLYFIALLATLLSAKTDDYISAKLVRPSGRYRAAGGRAIQFWEGMAYLRTVTALLAWLLVVSVRPCFRPCVATGSWCFLVTQDSTKRMNAARATASSIGDDVSRTHHASSVDLHE